MVCEGLELGFEHKSVWIPRCVPPVLVKCLWGVCVCVCCVWCVICVYCVYVVGDLIPSRSTLRYIGFINFCDF